MGKLVVTEFITLDGVVEDPGGAESFEYGGWSFQFNRGDDGDKFKLDETMASDAQLLGRVTYEGFAQAWPSMSNEFADKFNQMPKYVVSSTLTNPEWTNSTVVGTDLATTVSDLTSRYSGDVLVSGSIQLVQGLTELGLVDEYRLMVFPIALGKGKRLFGETSNPVRLTLTESRTVGSDGVVVLTYRRS